MTDNTTKPVTITQYLAALPKDRRDAIQAVRKVIRANLDPKFKEVIQYGAIGYVVPHSVYPAGYHCDPKQPLPFAGIASQKNHMSIHLFCLYTAEGEQRRFRDAWAKSGKRLDMGKSCARFRKIEDVPLELVGKTVKRITAKKFIAAYEAALGESGRTARKKTSKKKATTGKTTRKRTTTRRTTATSKKVTARKAATRTVGRTARKKKIAARPKRG